MAEITDDLIERVESDNPMAPEHRCRDFDEDCDDLDHTHCWLHDPTQGWCPFLRALKESRHVG